MRLRKTMVVTFVLAAAAVGIGCDREKPAAGSHAADAPMGYDPRAAPGTQSPQPRPGDNARPPATQADANVPEGTMVLADVDKQFIADAVRGNDLELKLAKLASTKAGSDAVKQYAKRMLDEHGAANQQLKLLATRIDANLANQGAGAGDAEDKAAEEFKNLSGAAFDQAYKQREIRAHQQAVARYQQAATQVKNAEVLDFINKTLPVLQDHRAAAQALPGGA